MQNSVKEKTEELSEVSKTSTDNINSNVVNYTPLHNVTVVIHHREASEILLNENEVTRKDEPSSFLEVLKSNRNGEST